MSPRIQVAMVGAPHPHSESELLGENLASAHLRRLSLGTPKSGCWLAPSPAHLLLPFDYDYREAGLGDSQHHLYKKRQPLLTN